MPDIDSEFPTYDGDQPVTAVDLCADLRAMGDRLIFRGYVMIGAQTVIVTAAILLSR